MPLSLEEQAFADEILRITGMKLGADKAYLIEHRLRDLGSSLAAIAMELRVARDPVLVDRVVDRILTHETSFFRDEHIFQTLAKQIIPEWMKRKGMDPLKPQDVRLKIWSCACSTGQEPYSIVMTVNETFPYLTGNLQLLATDITEETLTRARNAVYTDFEMSRGIQPAIQDRYFEKHEKGFKMREQFTRHVTFSKLNLVSDPYPTGFDIIFCRNVLIYMDESVKQGIFAKLQASLKTDGILILGGAESVLGFLDNYVLRRHEQTHYYELNPSKVTFFKMPTGDQK
ncbi:MAG: protein-glutamate O-methyltransferase CheR [Leptospirales bacterium]|nr:protein-glutamate O-methyltransferase CheR [Leptospirales bacterium]